MRYEVRMIQDLILLTSPPASGKTFWISSLNNAFYSERILVISPLRALADECRKNWQDSIDVMTPEEWLGKQIFRKIVIFDEFHLFFYWGDTFRERMWECFLELSQFSEQTYLLTATLSEAMKKEISFFETQFDRIFWVDQGNQRLKTSPSVYLKAPSAKWIKDLIEIQPKNESVKLIFCRYRNEVLDWEKRLRHLGFTTVSCLGGESQFMPAKLEITPFPDFIISTTVLSHGVNLPRIQKIYFLYPVQNIDFWIQMVARGGRRGESYQVFALERPFGLKWNWWTNLLAVSWISLKMRFKLTLRPAWFLKD